MSFPRILHLLVVTLSSVTCGALVTMGDPGDPATSAPAIKPADGPGIEHAHKLMAEGKFKEAKEELEALVRADKEMDGEQAAKTLADRLELAVARGKGGEPIKAEDELRALLPIFTRRNGPDHDETLNCRAALAGLLADVGRPSEAVDEYRRVLESRERTLGAGDVQVARVRHLLADALAAASKYVEAIEQYEKAEAVMEKVLGPEDAVTLLNRSNLANAKAETRQFKEAEKELTDILAIRERLFGPDHVSVLLTCYEIGRVMGGSGRYEEGLTYAQRAADGLTKTLSPTTRAAVNARKLCLELQEDLKRTESSKNPAQAAIPR